MEIFDKNVTALNSKVDIEAFYDGNIGKRHKGTCQWIFDLSEYKRWRSSETNGMLWICGEAGTLNISKKDSTEG